MHVGKWHFRSFNRSLRVSDFRWGKRAHSPGRPSQAESEANWKTSLLDLHRRGLKGASLQLITPMAIPAWTTLCTRPGRAAAHQRCWAHKLRNLENKLKASLGACLE